MKPWLVLAVMLAAPAALAQEPEAAMAAQHARPSPPWLADGVIYEVFARSFSPEGTLSGVTRRLDQLQHLGVNILWLMPINPHGELKKKGSIGSPYAVRDYFAIDPAYGNKGDLTELVREAHRRHMKVILDMVPNHTSWDSVMMAHPEFYKHDQAGQIISPHDWTDVAALNYANPDLRRYMAGMFAYWLKEFDLDGFRCDVASEVPTDFWEQTRVELQRIKPDMMMLAEASKPELLRSAFDIDYSWPLLSTLNDVMLHGAPASSVRDNIEQQRGLFPIGALHMRISDDHDEDRAIARYGWPGALAASALMFTLDGVPVLYNGMEVGDTTESGSPALFENLKVFWGIAERRPQFPKFYAKMIPLRRQHAAFWQGSLTWLHNSDERHVLSYLRQARGEQFLVVVNLSNALFTGTVEAPNGNWVEVDLGAPVHHAGLPAVSLDSFEFRVFQRAAMR